MSMNYLFECEQYQIPYFEKESILIEEINRFN